jgi:hypothetical protein
MKAKYNNQKVKQFIQDNIEYVVKDVNKISTYLFKKWGIVTSNKIREKIEDVNYILTEYVDIVYDYAISISMVNINPVRCWEKAYHFFASYDIIGHCATSQISFDDETKTFIIKAKYIGLSLGKYGKLLDNVLSLLNKSILDKEDSKYKVQFLERKNIKF